MCHHCSVSTVVTLFQQVDNSIWRLFKKRHAQRLRSLPRARVFDPKTQFYGIWRIFNWFCIPHVWLLCIIHTLTQYHQSQSFSHCFNFCLSSSLLTPWATSFKNLPLSFRCSKILELALYTNSGNSTGSGDRTKSVALSSSKMCYPCSITLPLPKTHT